MFYQLGVSLAVCPGPNIEAAVYGELRGNSPNSGVHEGQGSIDCHVGGAYALQLAWPYFCALHNFCWGISPKERPLHSKMVRILLQPGSQSSQRPGFRR